MKIALCLLPLLAGCSFLAPGLDTRVAAEATSDTQYTADGGLNIKKSTTHNQRTVVAEGKNVTVEYYDDGSPRRIEGATNVLTECSEPKDVMTAYMQLAIENAKVAARMMETLDRLIPIAIAHLAPVEPTANGQPAGTRPTIDVQTRIQILRDLQEAIRAAATQPGG